MVRGLYHSYVALSKQLEGKSEEAQKLHGKALLDWMQINESVYCVLTLQQLNQIDPNHYRKWINSNQYGSYLRLAEQDVQESQFIELQRKLDIGHHVSSHFFLSY